MGKETKFGGAWMFDIILQHWFPIDPNFQLLEFKDEDEDKDTSSIKLNFDIKCTVLEPLEEKWVFFTCPM